MERETVNKMVSLYQELKHLKLVGEELQIPWQTVYLWLKKLELRTVKRLTLTKMRRNNESI